MQITKTNDTRDYLVGAHAHVERTVDKHLCITVDHSVDNSFWKTVLTSVLTTVLEYRFDHSFDHSLGKQC